MSHTVIGIFKTFTEASVARQHLENNGFNPANIDVAESGYTAPHDGTTTVDEEHKSIGSFFSNLFGGKDDDEDILNRHIEAGKRGTIITVHANGYDEAERAADILDEFGAVNVNDNNDWDRESMRMPLTGDFDTATTSNYADIPAIDATPAGGFGSAERSDFEEASLADINDTTSAGYTADADTETRLGHSLTGDLPGSPADPDSIKVVQENLNISKEEVQTGGVRLRSRIVSRPVEESVRLRQERVTVNRKAVDRPATEADFETFKEGTIELTESQEVPVVNKEARVVEEISLNKEVTESEQTIVDTVRHTEVDTENLDPNNPDSPNNPDKHLL